MKCAKCGKEIYKSDYDSGTCLCGWTIMDEETLEANKRFVASIKEDRKSMSKIRNSKGCLLVGFGQGIFFKQQKLVAEYLGMEYGFVNSRVKRYKSINGYKVYTDRILNILTDENLKSILAKMIKCGKLNTDNYKTEFELDEFDLPYEGYEEFYDGFMLHDYSLCGMHGRNGKPIIRKEF